MSDPARRYSHIVRAVRQRPWAIDPASKEWAAMLDIVDLRAAGSPLTAEEIQTRISAAVNGPRNGAAQGQGVAIIPVYGVISHRMDLMSQMSGGTSVQGLQRAFRSALADPDVGAIVLDVDSPGGSVEGIFEFAEELFAARGQKPMVAVANSTMASAAYLLGSQADEVIASPSSVVGSIGVIGQHVDVSAQDEMLGEKVTLITAGEGKGNANEHVPLSEAAHAELQSMADDYYGLFVKAVAGARGVKASQVTEDWKAQVFTARKAKTAGLVDRVDTLEATVQRMVTKVSRNGLSNGLGAAYAPPPFDASAIGRHKTATSDGAWDGPVNEKRLPNERGPLRSSHAWVDDDGDPDAKSSYRFIHHEVHEDGVVGAANLTACSTGIGVLNGGRGGTTIPAADRSGVHAHLAGHLTDAGREAPPLQGEHPATGIAALLATMDPIQQRAVLADHVARLQAEAEPVAPSEPAEHLPDGPVEVIANADDERRRRLSVARANAALAIAHSHPFKEVSSHV